MHDYAQNKRVFWSRKMLEYFIQLYRQHECLYDMHHKDFNNRCRKMEASENILQKMRKFIPDLMIDDVRAKIEAIRTQLSNEFSQIEEAEISGEEYVPKLWCFELLSFLHKHMTTSITIENVEKKQPLWEPDEIDDTDSDGENSLFSELNLDKLQRKYAWSRDDVTIFIKIFKRYSILYDPNNKNYKHRERRNEARRKILMEMKRVAPNITLNDVCVKIKNLRCQYTRELRRLALVAKTNTTYIPKFWCFNELSFLNNRGLAVKRMEEYAEEYQTESCKNNTTNYLEDNSEDNVNDYTHNETLDDEQIEHINEDEIEFDEKVIKTPTDSSTELFQVPDDDVRMMQGSSLDDGDDPIEIIQDVCDQEIAEADENDSKQGIRKVILPAESNKRSKRKAPIEGQDGKFEWLGELVVGQMHEISPTFRTEFAWDVQCLIRKYILKTNEEKESPSTSTDANKKDPSSKNIILPRSSNVSLNISFL